MFEENDNTQCTARGFRAYGEFTDACDNKVRVQESSAVGRPKAHIFCRIDKDKNGYRNRLMAALVGVDIPSPELLEMCLEATSPLVDVAQAKELIRQLQVFVEHAESDDNWRNGSDYKEKFG